MAGIGHCDGQFQNKKKLFGLVYTYESTTTQPLVLCERNSEQVRSLLIQTGV